MFWLPRITAVLLVHVYWSTHPASKYWTNNSLQKVISSIQRLRRCDFKKTRLDFLPWPWNNIQGAVPLGDTSGLFFFCILCRWTSWTELFELFTITFIHVCLFLAKSLVKGSNNLRHTFWLFPWPQVVRYGRHGPWLGYPWGLESL